MRSFLAAQFHGCANFFWMHLSCCSIGFPFAHCTINHVNFLDLVWTDEFSVAKERFYELFNTKLYNQNIKFNNNSSFKKKINNNSIKKLFFYLSKKKLTCQKMVYLIVKTIFKTIFFINITLLICIFRYVTKRSNWMLDWHIKVVTWDS